MHDQTKEETTIDSNNLLLKKALQISLDIIGQLSEALN
jgi:hypothetical protein